MNIPILFEDKLLLVVDKPVGISVTEEVDTSTVRQWVKERYNYQSVTGLAEDEFEQRYGIVHRLDKETSGVLLIAKNKDVFQYMKGLFKYRRAQKEYQALVYGTIRDQKFEISAPISRNTNTGTTYKVDVEGRDSLTEFQVEKYLSHLLTGGNEIKTTYLKAYPKTGRTHQIRVHLKTLGYPVVNDVKYANQAQLSLSEGLSDRMMLHAKRLSFIDWDGKNRVFESPLNILDCLKA